MLYSERGFWLTHRLVYLKVSMLTMTSSNTTTSKAAFLSGLQKKQSVVKKETKTFTDSMAHKMRQTRNRESEV